MLKFSPSLYFQNATCPHWIWHDHFSDRSQRGDVPELAQKLMEQGVVHEQDYISHLRVETVGGAISAETLQRTKDLMQHGVAYIYQGSLSRIDTTEDGEEIEYRGQPDLLERREGTSQFGNYYYAPVDIKSSKEIKREQWLQLATYAHILETAQGYYPTDVAIINRENQQIELELDSTHRSKWRQQTNTILDIMRGNKPPLRLASKCKNSPWYHLCISDAEAVNDIALIYKLDSRAAEGMRAAGFTTVKSVAEARLDQLPVLPHLTYNSLERVQQQAKSLQSNSLYWLAKPTLPSAPIHIYFDIEGDPLLQLEYLFGFWVKGDVAKKFSTVGQVRSYPDKDEYYVYFMAESPDQESSMWAKVREWFDLLQGQEYVLFHYADYERNRLFTLSEKYGGSIGVEYAQTKLMDLMREVQRCVILPLYFYSIKDIAKSPFVGYKWRHAKAGGAQSIFWYEKWLETADMAVLDDIVNYNEDDVIATQALEQWLNTAVIN